MIPSMNVAAERVDRETAVPKRWTHGISGWKTKRGRSVSQPLTSARWWKGCIINPRWFLVQESHQPNISVVSTLMVEATTGVRRIRST